MTLQTTTPSPAQAQPVAAPVQKEIDWRQLDFAADGLVMRSATEPKR